MTSLFFLWWKYYRQWTYTKPIHISRFVCQHLQWTDCVCTKLEADMDIMDHEKKERMTLRQRLYALTLGNFFQVCVRLSPQHTHAYSTTATQNNNQLGPRTRRPFHNYFSRCEFSNITFLIPADKKWSCKNEMNRKGSEALNSCIRQESQRIM